MFCTCLQIQAQYSTLNAHSHNDYQQKSPLYLAYNNHFGSIEADIWEVNGNLFVAHEKEKITPERSLEELYINPIINLYKQNCRKAWSDHPGSFQLMIELKSQPETALSLLVDKLKKYPEVFDPKVNKNAVRIVITGNEPNPSDFNKYPDFISFDGDIELKYIEQQRNRLALYSGNLAKFISWKGKGNIPEIELQRLKQVIDSIHGLNCKIRFWNAPDTPNAWKTLINLKVDYINTDHIQELSDFLETNKN